jgi:membrane protein implicated in regulation of membrane protease activity
MEEFLKKYLGKKNQKSSFKLYRIFLENNSNKKNNLLLAKESREGEDYFKNEDQRIKEEERRILTYYFDKQPISDPDSENFFGNGILLHKLRTSTSARYFNSVTLLKMLAFEPILVSLQMIPGLQVSLLVSVQLAYVIWLAFCGFKDKIFVSKAVFLATLVCDTSILVFLILGLVFQISGGVKAWPAGASGPLQFGGAGLLLLACLFGVVDLTVSAWLAVKAALAKRKVQKFLDERKKRKDQQEESMIKLRDEEGQKSQAVEPSPEPMGLMDRRALSPFWRLKFKKASAPDDQTLKRPDLQLV